METTKHKPRQCRLHCFPPFIERLIGLQTCYCQPQSHKSFAVAITAILLCTLVLIYTTSHQSVVTWVTKELLEEPYHRPPHMPTCHKQSPNLSGNITAIAHRAETSGKSFEEAMLAMDWNSVLEKQKSTDLKTWIGNMQGVVDVMWPYIAMAPVAPVNESCKPRELPKTVACKEHPYTGAFSKARSKPAYIINAFLFGYDVDSLEIRLQELNDVVDKFIIIESLLSHLGLHKALGWEHIKQQTRFVAFSSKVIHLILDDADVMKYQRKVVQQAVNWASNWASESTQTSALISKMSKLVDDGILPGDSIVLFGHTDEVPKRESVWMLKQCEMVAPHMAAGIWFPMGKVDRAFRSDFPAHSNANGKPLEYTIAVPSINLMSAVKSKDVKHIYADRSVRHLPGGMHMSNYPYLPYILTKAMTCTECGGLPPKTHSMLGQGQFRELFDKESSLSGNKGWKSNTIPLAQLFKTNSYYKAIVHVPWFLRCNPDRYSSWWGIYDKRHSTPLVASGPVNCRVIT